ncbi:uncharacterized protein LOC142230859 [Haematobia irritans]|uniref:uncharacterized protein LOC142230859 n=1 Tax=Haematobia irritans TaxID=7368 RepID=UPI003F4F42B1
MDTLRDNNFEIIFTDGSVREGKTGAAFFHPGTNTSQGFFVCKRLSSMTSELMAFVKALEFAKESGFLKAAIVTDSLSGILALEGDFPDNYLCHMIVDLTHALPLGAEFHYIPGHSGIRPNEIVDDVAKNAFAVGIHWNIQWPLKDAIKEIELQLWDEWSAEYSRCAENANAQFFQIFPSVSRKPWFKNRNIQPERIKLLNRILTNHGFCAYDLAKFKVVASDLCDACNIEDTPEHIVFHCDKGANGKEEIFKAVWDEFEFKPGLG